MAASAPGVADILADLIRIPSVNPMGRDVSGPEYYEKRLTDALQQRFETLDLPWERQTVAPGRDNIHTWVAGTRPPEEGGGLVVFEVHQDTVPVDGMTVAPWEPTRDGDRIHGRGACDVKGGMACMLAAVEQIRDRHTPHMPTVVLACSVNEESGFTGAYAMADAWQHHGLTGIPRKPDAVIVAEPTSLDVVVAHKGVVRWRCASTGRAAHSSCPQNGVNAIYNMAPALIGLQAYQRSLGQTEPHPTLGTPTLSVGTIRGGLSVNTVPDRCEIEIDVRLLPDVDPMSARQQTLDWMAEHVPTARAFEHAPPFLAARGLSDQHNQRLADLVANVVKQHGHAGHQIGVPYATDAHAFAQLGIPTVVFGPGSVNQAHTVDEWVSVKQLEATVAILVDTIAAFESRWNG